LSFEEVYHTVSATLSADILESKAHIECDFNEAPQIYFPKSYLESIVQNLLSNAIKYRHPDREPEIKLKTYKSGKYTCFKISDNGLGIDMEKNSDNVFGMYKTFHKDHDSKGIGLYITKAQVLALGGTIDVDSTPNVGTTFTICV
jgi:signal transduction histidine kinase